MTEWSINYFHSIYTLKSSLDDNQYLSLIEEIIIASNCGRETNLGFPMLFR